MIEWLPVPDYPGYKVSSNGCLYSIEHQGFIFPNAHGKICLKRCDGDYDVIGLGVLILTVFVGPRPPDLECCHWDDNQLNNNITNLRWDTRSANKQDAVRNGRMPNVLMSATKVAEARALRKMNRWLWTYNRLAAKFGVSYSTMRKIIGRTIWRNVPDEDQATVYETAEQASQEHQAN